MVFAALVKRDHVAPQTGLVERLLLDRRHDRPPGGERLRRRHLGFDGRVDPLRHVLDRPQDVQLQVGAL